MLARLGAAPRYVEMGARRRQHHDGVDARVGENGFKLGAGRERKVPSEGLAPCRARTEGVYDLHAVAEILQRACMGR